MTYNTTIDIVRRLGSPLAALLLLVLLGCGSSRSAPLELAAVEMLLTTQLSIMSAGIEREDFILASQPVGDLFIMGPNVALRYGSTTFPPANVEPRGLRPFRTFFNEAFKSNANISQSFTIEDIELNGDVATLTVASEFNSTRVDVTPPQNTTAALDDYMVFQREEGTWRLISWDEIPAEVPVDPPLEGEPVA